MAVIDIKTDFVLLYKLRHLPRTMSYFWIFFGMLVTSCFANFTILYYVLGNEIVASPVFSEWRLNNASAFNVAALFSWLYMQTIYIINSRVLDIGATNAPLSFDALRRLNMFSYVSLLIENIPQLLLQLLILLTANGNDRNVLGRTYTSRSACQYTTYCWLSLVLFSHYWLPRAATSQSDFSRPTLISIAMISRNCMIFIGR